MNSPSSIGQTARDTFSVLTPPAVVLIAHILRVFLLTPYTSFDMLMHFLGGASICASALLFGRIARRRGALPADTPSWLIGVALLGTVALVGVFWEFHEFALDQIFHTAAQGGLADTMSDLALDLLGGVAMVLATPWIAGRMKK